MTWVAKEVFSEMTFKHLNNKKAVACQDWKEHSRQEKITANAKDLKVELVQGKIS